MKLVVGFLTYNEVSAKYLPDFLSSLVAALSFLKPAEYRILALDNSDQTNNHNRLALEFFNSHHQNLIEYLGAGENLGFSRAYNILINRARQAGAEYFLVINPDTFLDASALKELVQALDADPRLAAVSPKILRWDFTTNTKTKIIDSGGLILQSGLRFKDLGQGQEDRKQFDKTRIIGPSGAAGLFRLSVLESLSESGQYFDERFFMYKEDCDLAYRLVLNNLESKLIPNALIYHDRTAASSGQGLGRIIADRRQKSRQVRAWSFKNQHLLFIKYWEKQTIVNKIVIGFRVFSMFIFSLTLEQFLLNTYPKIIKTGKS